MARLTTRLVKIREACRALGICDDTFSAHWQGVFTETRDPGERKKGVHRRVFEDELAEAVSAGGGTSNRAKAAVLTFRRMMGRALPEKPARSARAPARSNQPEPPVPTARDYANLLVRLAAVEAKLERILVGVPIPA